jgi:hypothetical protein
MTVTQHLRRICDAVPNPEFTRVYCPPPSLLPAALHVCHTLAHGHIRRPALHPRALAAGVNVVAPKTKSPWPAMSNSLARSRRCVNGPWSRPLSPPQPPLPPYRMLDLTSFSPLSTPPLRPFFSSIVACFVRTSDLEAHLVVAGDNHAIDS